MLSFIWAEDQDRNIGFYGHLPWHLPADLKHFKEKTMGHPIVMGRKTFASFPHLLPGRHHVVLTSNQKIKQNYENNSQVTVLTSIDELNRWLDQHKKEDICVIGGVSVFNALLSRVDCLEKTEIAATFKADTKMPMIDYNQFTLVKREVHQHDEKNKYDYAFLTYYRKSKE